LASQVARVEPIWTNSNKSLRIDPKTPKPHSSQIYLII